MYLSFFLGAQGAYPPPSGFQQYPPPYPGSAVENTPLLASKSDDYNRQSAFNPNVWKYKPESLISYFENDGWWKIILCPDCYFGDFFFVKSIILKKKGNIYMTCIILHCITRARYYTTVCF